LKVSICMLFLRYFFRAFLLRVRSLLKLFSL
jgi:hypothetical protein